MIAKFLNATTADGYNPYRVTRDGIEWEVPEPDNPWSNIGYWSDHQIIYLQKLLEIAEQVHPGRLAQLWNQPVFAYADVPYRLQPYEEMLEDWYNTIDFDWESEEATETAVAAIGTDGRLLRDRDGQRHPCHDGRKAAGAAAGQAHQPGAGGRHLDEHAASRMERRQQRPGRQRTVGGHSGLPTPLHRFLAGAVGGARGKIRFRSIRPLPPSLPRCGASWTAYQPYLETNI